MNVDLNDIKNITLYTGDDNFCVCKCPNCSQGMAVHNSRYSYQGTEEQINDFINYFPNLEKLYILGNPDIAKDTGYCNKVARECLKKLNLKVSFCTSGVGGKNTMEKLLDGILPEDVEYVVFSFDSLNKKTMDLLKGINYPMDRAIEGLKYVMQRGYRVRVQPTLWRENYNELYDTLNYFYDLGVRTFTMHVGSLESNNVLHHLTEKELLVVNDEIEKFISTHNDVSIKLPVIYPSLGENDKKKYYCMEEKHIVELLCSFKKDGIWCTNLPIASSLKPELLFKLDKNKEKYNVSYLIKKNDKFTCPISNKLSNKCDNYCRFVTKHYGLKKMECSYKKA